MNVIRCYLRDRRAWPFSLSTEASWARPSGPIMHQNGSGGGGGGGWGTDRPEDGRPSSRTVLHQYHGDVHRFLHMWIIYKGIRRNISVWENYGFICDKFCFVWLTTDGCGPSVNKSARPLVVVDLYRCDGCDSRWGEETAWRISAVQHCHHVEGWRIDSWATPDFKMCRTLLVALSPVQGRHPAKTTPRAHLGFT